MTKSSDNTLAAGTVHLVFTEGLNPSGIPGEPVQGHPDAVFCEKIGYVLKKYIEMAGEETGLGSRRLTEKFIDTPDPDGIIPVKSKGRSVCSDAGTPEIAGRITQPAGRITQQSVKALEHPSRQGEAELVDERPIHIICGETQDPILVQDDTESAVLRGHILAEGAEFILKNRLMTISGNQSVRPLSVSFMESNTFDIIVPNMTFFKSCTLHLVVKSMNFL